MVLAPCPCSNLTRSFFCVDRVESHLSNEGVVLEDFSHSRCFCFVFCFLFCYCGRHVPEEGEWFDIPLFSFTSSVFCFFVGGLDEMDGWMRMSFMIKNEVRRVEGSWEFGPRSAVSFFWPFLFYEVWGDVGVGA